MNRKIVIGGVVALGLAAMIGFGLMNSATVVRAASQAGKMFSTTQQAAADVKGLVIVMVEADGPADKAGVLRGDILLKMGDTEVNKLPEVQTALASQKVGDVVTLSLTRGDQSLNIDVTLGERNGKPYLGITPLPGAMGQRMRGIMPKARADITNTLTMSVPHVLIVSVVKDSPADIAGMKPGDHVLSVDGKTLDGTANLGELIRTYKVGDTVTLEVAALGETAREVKVVLTDNPNQTGTPYIGVKFALEPGFGKAGKRGGRGFEGVKPFLSGGAVVRSVTAGSPAEKAGIKVGDSIVSVNGKTMATPVALAAEIASLKIGDEVTLGVKAQSATAATDIKVTLGENPNKAGTPWLGITLGGNMRIRPGRPGELMPGGRGFDMPDMGGTLEDTQPAAPAGDTL